MSYKFCKPRSVPAIEEELHRLEWAGELEKVAYSKWATPLVDDLFATLAGGETFTVLDLSQAYQQLLDDDSRQYVSQYSQRASSLYTWCHLSVSPSISRGSWTPNCKVCQESYVILTTSWSLAPMTQNISRILRTVAPVRTTGQMCFPWPRVNYLGYQIDAEGLQATKEKFEAILNAHFPKNV